MGKKQRAWSAMVNLRQRYCCPLTHLRGNLPSLVVLQEILPWIHGQPWTSPGEDHFCRVVSVDFNNQAKDANIIMTQNKQLILHPNPTNPSKEKPKFPFQYVKCNHTHPRTLVTSKWVDSKQRSDQVWWSWVALDQRSEKNLLVITSNFLDAAHTIIIIIIIKGHQNKFFSFHAFKNLSPLLYVYS